MNNEKHSGEKDMGGVGGLLVSLVLPVYNCYPEFEAGLPVLTEVMRRLGYGHEIIVVDDCSRQERHFKGEILEGRSLEGDSFRQVAERCGCVYIRNESNRGKGYSVRKGIEAADGEFILFMDGDFPFELEVIGRAVDAFLDEEVDMVIGDRTLPGSLYPKNSPLLRKAGSRILSFLAGNYFTPGFFDTQCGVKGFRRTVARELLPDMGIDGFSFDIEILYVALKRKYRIARIPVNAKKQGSSHVRVVWHGLQTLGNLLYISLKHIRGKYKARGRRGAGQPQD